MIISKEEIEKLMKELKRYSSIIFSNKDFSDANRQKLIYSLLNKIKANDQKEFLWTLLRQINAYNNEESLKEPIKKLTENISQVWINLSSDAFSKYSYSIVLGVMSANDNKLKMEAIKNE